MLISDEKKFVFESMSVPKAIKFMAIPTIISQLINLIYNMVDGLFIGRSGNPYMTASLTVSFTLFLMTIPISNLCGVGGGSQIARLNGINEGERSKNLSVFSVYCCLLFSIIYSLFIYFFQEKILILFGASQNTLQYAKQYLLMTVVIGGPVMILAINLSHLLRNCGYSKQASFGLSMGGILNIILDPIFMFVVFERGREVFAAGVATFISNIVSFLYLLYHYIKLTKVANLSLDIKRFKKTHSTDKKMMFTVGVPAALLTALFDLSNIVLNMLVSGYGDLYLAAIGISMRIERIPNAICLGLCQGALPIVAYNYSQKNKKRMNDVIKANITYGLIICFLSILFLQIFATPLSKLFMNISNGNNKNAAKTIIYAATFIKYRSFVSAFQFLNYQSSYTLQAIGAGKETFIHSVIRILACHIPIMHIFNYLFGIYGLTSSIILSEAIGAIIAYALLKNKLKESA